MGELDGSIVDVLSGRCFCFCGDAVSPVGLAILVPSDLRLLRNCFIPVCTGGGMFSGRVMVCTVCNTRRNPCRKGAQGAIEITCSGDLFEYLSLYIMVGYVLCVGLVGSWLVLALFRLVLAHVVCCLVVWVKTTIEKLWGCGCIMWILQR